MRNKFLKLITAFLCGVLALSCNKTPKMQEVVFMPNLIETNSITRATDHNEILSLIESTYTEFAVNFYTNEADNQFTRIEFGRTYTLPIGNFHVKGYNQITVGGNFNSKYSLALSPQFYVDTYVDIQYGTTEYAIPVEVRSAAIVFDRSEVYQIQYKGQSGSYIPLSTSDLVLSDNYGLFFINGVFSGTMQAAIKVIPKSGANKETEFIFAYDEVGTGSAIYGKLESSKYYVLHPNPVTELSGVSFSLSIPSWECSMD